MEDHRSKVAQALEGMLTPKGFQWAEIVVIVSMIYFIFRFIPWAIMQFPIVGY